MSSSAPTMLCPADQQVCSLLASTTAGGGEDLDFNLQLGGRMRAVPGAAVVHPWWPEGRPWVSGACLPGMLRGAREVTVCSGNTVLRW